MKKYYEVILPTAKRPTYFEATHQEEYTPWQRVVVDSARGRELGTISSLPPLWSPTPPPRPDTLTSVVNKEATDSILQVATPQIILQAKERELEAVQALKLARERVQAYQLPMRLLGAFINLDHNRIVFEFCADKRIDFRALVRDLAARLKMRVELRQMGPRDRAILLGGRGICGRQLCCAIWLQDFSSVSVKMAKNQGLSLNPHKVSGACGHLMCCLKFEQASYDNPVPDP